jgi:hypothetical protein
MGNISWQPRAKEEAEAGAGDVYPDDSVTWHEEIVQQHASQNAGARVSIRLVIVLHVQLHQHLTLIYPQRIGAQDQRRR